MTDTKKEQKKAIKISFESRLYLAEIMPEKDSYTNGIIKEDVEKKVKITQEELKDHNFTVKGDTMGWTNGEKEKKVNLTALEEQYLKEKLTEVEAARQLHAKLRPLYKLLVLNG